MVRTFPSAPRWPETKIDEAIAPASRTTLQCPGHDLGSGEVDHERQVDRCENLVQGGHPQVSRTDFTHRVKIEVTDGRLYVPEPEEGRVV